MTETVPTHEVIETWVGQKPKSIIDQLPDSIEKREATRLIDCAEQMAHQARERHVREE